MKEISRHADFTEIRTFDPGAGTTFTETDWVLTQNIAAAEAVDSLFMVSPRQTFPADLRFYIMITLLGSDGKPVADQAAVKVATLSFDEIAIVNGEKRLAYFGSTADFSSNGLIVSGTILSGLGHGVFVPRLTNVTAMPAGVKTISVDCKFRSV